MDVVRKRRGRLAVPMYDLRFVNFMHVTREFLQSRDAVHFRITMIDCSESFLYFSTSSECVCSVPEQVRILS